VSGAWREPAAICNSPGGETDAAIWVGLGGYSETSPGLEQVGTDADCTSSGHPVYDSWFELLPAEPVNLRLAVHPGDEMGASVTIANHDVTLRIRDLTTGKRFSVTRHIKNIDRSSAEWIVEAPSLCPSSQTCNVLKLTDFGQVSFSAASAVARGHTGAISDSHWSATAIELRQPVTSSVHGRAGASVSPARPLTLAIPSPSTPLSGAFSVSFAQESHPGPAPGSPPATLPGSSGGAH